MGINQPSSAMSHAYFGPRDQILEDVLRKSLLDLRMPPIQIDDNAGRILQLLTLILQPRQVIEIGALFGYSTIHIARGLPAGATVTALEIDERAAKLAQENILAAELDDVATIVNRDAIDYLQTIEPESIDMIFIDGAKRDYPKYLKYAFGALRSGGLLIADDVFAESDFAEAEGNEDNEQELRGIIGYNKAVGQSPRLFSALIGTEHGFLISRKN